METKITCPLGSECEKAVDGHIERCAWYVKLEGNHPQSGERIDESRCAMAWQPILLIEANGQLNSLGASVDSARNETVKRQDAFLGMVNNASKITHK